MGKPCLGLGLRVCGCLGVEFVHRPSRNWNVSVPCLPDVQKLLELCAFFFTAFTLLGDLESLDLHKGDNRQVRRGTIHVKVLSARTLIV